MNEYTLSDGTAIIIKSYEEWLQDRIHMTEEEFRIKLGKRKEPLFKDKWWPVDKVIEIYHNKYRQYVDRIHLDHISLTFSEYLESYEGRTAASFHEMCAATGAGAKEENRWLEWIRNDWEKHENNLIPF